MNEPADLLPPNASATERNLSKTIARLSDIPMMVRQSWNPNACPVELLPWLAWSFSVDEWDDEWGEKAKRQVIQNAHYVHRKKGTLSAIRNAVEPLGYLIKVVEWFEEEPVGVPFTFSVEVGVTKPLSETVYEQILRLVETYKNERSHLGALTVKANVSGKAFIGTAIMSGLETTIYPYIPEDLTSHGFVYTACAEQSVDRVCIYPLS